MTIPHATITTDILVIGAGSAGTMAAIKSKMAGGNVLVVTKGPFPSGNSTKALAGYAAAFGHADSRDNTDIHFGDVVRNGIGLSNQRMVKTWVNNICELTEEMRSWGLDLIREGDKYNQRPWEGHTYPRMVHHHWTTGKYIMKCLGAKAEELNIRALSHSIVGGLFKDGEAISGAWVIDYRTGELSFIRAKSVFVTTGGCGALYPVGDNVGAATGEGYALAYDAGAEMIGMEFSHFLPTPVFPESLRVKFTFAGLINGLVNEGGARLLNRNGKEFFYDKFPESGAAKLKMEDLTRYIGEELLKGGGTDNGGIIFDVENVPDELKKHPRYSRLWELADRAKVKFSETPLEVSTSPHDLVGGIKINEKGETNVPGLYAAGEATGGSHGASRFGGSALSDCMVFGALGAIEAVQYTNTLGNHPTIAAGDMAAVKEKLSNWKENRSGVDPADILKQNRQIASAYLNVVRSEESINKALAEISDIELNLVSQITVLDENKRKMATKIRQAIEAEGQLTLCRLFVAASLERKESRGGYFGGSYRLEFPDKDDENWLKNIVLKKENGIIDVSHDEVVHLDGNYSPDMLTAMSTQWEIPDDPEYYSTTE